MISKPALVLTLAGALAFGACSKNANLPAAACPPCEAQKSANADQVVATYANHKVTMGELDEMIAKDVFEMRRQALEAMIISKLVEEKAKAAGKDPETFLRGIAEQSVAAPIPEEQLKAMYERAKPQLGDKSFEEVKPMIEGMMKQEAQKKAMIDYIDQLRKEANVQILLEEPKVDVKAEGPSKGPADAPVTIVEFSDFECPYCSRAAQTVDKIVENNAGKVRLVFRSYPLPFHKNAKKASEAALCANEQGKFWQMHDALFANQQKLEIADLKATAKTLGLDSAAFDACLDSGKFAAQIDADLKAGEKAGVEGTPAFFINGRFVAGALPYEQFQTIVEQELAKAKK